MTNANVLSVWVGLALLAAISDAASRANDVGCHGGFPKLEGNYNGENDIMYHTPDHADDEASVRTTPNFNVSFFNPTKDGRFIQFDKIHTPAQGDELLHEYGLCGWKSHKELICVDSDDASTDSYHALIIDDDCVAQRIEKFGWEPAIAPPTLGYNAAFVARARLDRVPHGPSGGGASGTGGGGSRHDDSSGGDDGYISRRGYYDPYGGGGTGGGGGSRTHDGSGSSNDHGGGNSYEDESHYHRINPLNHHDQQDHYDRRRGSGHYKGGGGRGRGGGGSGDGDYEYPRYYY